MGSTRHDHKTGQEITGSDLKTVGKFMVTLSSVGNPDHGQNPDHSLPGLKSSKVAVTTKQEAAEACRKFIDDNQLGSGNWSGGDVFSEGNLVARVSYNGRVWHLDDEVCKTIERPRG